MVRGLDESGSVRELPAAKSACNLLVSGLPAYPSACRV